ncbi:MAG: cobalamin biosynthesis protein [Rhodospirillales bacterium]|nr:cobalamin biosynthesis protein [Rhodospirillales bacterium]
MFSFGLVGGTHAFDPLVLLLTALGVEALVGGFEALFRFIPHPEQALARTIGSLEAKLNREKRSPMDRAIRGLFLAAVMIGVALGIGVGVAWLSQNHDFGWIVEFVLLAALINQRSLYNRMGSVARSMGGGNLESARAALQPMVNRDTALMDDHGIARTTIEAGAEGFGAGVVAPVFWYVLFGFPGLAVCRTISVMDRVIGHPTPRYRAFGMTAARLNDAVHLIPSCLSGIFLAFAALFAPTAQPGSALRIMMRDSSKYRSLGAGWPVAAVAGALNLALAGPRRYAEKALGDPWVGSGTAQVEGNDIRRAQYLFAIACLIDAMIVAALVIVRLNISG